MKSLEELAAIRDKMKNIVNTREAGENNIRIAVGMATCGIAAGARPVLNAFTEEVARRETDMLRSGVDVQLYKIRDKVKQLYFGLLTLEGREKQLDRADEILDSVRMRASKPTAAGMSLSVRRLRTSSSSVPGMFVFCAAMTSPVVKILSIAAPAAVFCHRPQSAGLGSTSRGACLFPTNVVRLLGSLRRGNQGFHKPLPTGRGS